MKERFDKICTFLIEHLEANKGKLRIILRVLKFQRLFASKWCFNIVLRIPDPSSKSGYLDLGRAILLSLSPYNLILPSGSVHICIILLYLHFNVFSLMVSRPSQKFLPAVPKPEAYSAIVLSNDSLPSILSCIVFQQPAARIKIHIIKHISN